MLSARKASSASIYHRVWKTFFSWCRLRGHPPLRFSIPCILNFLQSGLDSGLALSSLKGQISALSVLFQRRIATNLQVKTFVQGVSHVVPPYRMPLETWDLNLVLGVLQEPPFEPLQDVPLSVLSWKVAFLVAVTSIRRVSELAALSCRAPFLAFHQDKVVLRPSPAFLPKVVSAFHLNEDIILPSFCPQPKHRVEKALHTLDVVRALRRYISRTAHFRKSDALFVLPEGHRKGLAASKSTIARWIRSAIQESYRCQPPSDSSITHGPVSPNEWLGEKDFTSGVVYSLSLSFQQRHVSRASYPLQKHGLLSPNQDFPTVSFLVMITFIRLVSELEVLFHCSPFLEFHEDKTKLLRLGHRLEVTTCDLTRMQLQLDEKQAELEMARAKLDGAMLEKMNLLQEVELCRKKIENASAMIEGLSEEKIRWTEQSRVLKCQMDSLVGDVLIVATFLSYCGPFNQTFRDLLLKDTWEMEIRSRNIPFSANLNIVSMFVDQPTVNDWILQGLPRDDISIQNGIIMTKATRYPLLIDPQAQGKAWIKMKEKINDLQSQIVLHPSGRLPVIGRPLLIEDIGEELDPSLENILEQNFIKSGTSFKVKVGHKVVDVVDKFRLYMTSKLPNPVFTPEISAKTSIIDFSVTKTGLEKLLLGRVVLAEQEELEVERITLMQEVNVNTRRMRELEDSLLLRLSAMTGSLVEDKSLADVLRITQQIVSDLSEKLFIAADTEVKISKAQVEYHPVASRGSILYFLASEMSTVNAMYSTSLRQFLKLFDRSIARSDRSPHLHKRKSNIAEYLTYEAYRYYTRGLYEKHRLLFTLLLALRVDLQQGNIKHKELQTFLQGGAGLDLKSCPPKPFKWILDTTWLNLVELSKLSQFSELMAQVTRNERGWRIWFDREAPEDEMIPNGYNSSLDTFHRLLLVRSCCPDRTLPQARKYIRNSLNAKYTEPVILNLVRTWEESDTRTPLICLLSRGTDPTNQIEALAKNLRLGCKAISMGPGQAVHARRALQISMQQGGWVLLQNCHLDLDFMDELLEIIETVAAVHETFRVWMTTEPHRQFPISLLQASIKFTNESPQGMRAGLKRTYTGITQNLLDGSRHPMWKPLLYSLAFLHSAVQERRRYTTRGWNIPYEFSSADFSASVQVIQNHLDECGVRKGVSWSTMRYMIGKVQYGGSITDQQDERLLSCMVKAWFSEKIIDPIFCFYTGYKIPHCKTVQQFLNHIQSLPAADSPLVFGLHSNADITYQSNVAATILNTISSMQPQETQEEAGETQEAVVYRIAEDLLEKLPPDYNPHEVKAQLEKTGALSPINLILCQEINRMQKVISIVRRGLSELRLAIDGTVIMSESLRAVLDDMYNARVPGVWRKVSWASATLGFWFTELLKRNHQFTLWIYDERPNVFWMAGFFNPQGFLTAIKQEFARQHKGWTLDCVTMQNVVLKHMKEEIRAPPAEGVYVHGLFLEGAGWDRKTATLTECVPKVLFTMLPVVHLFAVNSPAATDPASYICPVYKKPERTDVHYVTTVSLKSSEPPDHWILRRVAALCDIN
ncbi:unnamed protein product [Ranitomeya imitator]|uniref:Core-binding (CB) domain-containing protein n=1 Tax=Ranitomeya imitator TaxID=111125 RepID=A0ABN9LGW9_9NEOB|nr:unnamed protein product [Ranitomeya imitator]